MNQLLLEFSKNYFGKKYKRERRVYIYTHAQRNIRHTQHKIYLL